jgi:hypothetical protein
MATGGRISLVMANRLEGGHAKGIEQCEENGLRIMKQRGTDATLYGIKYTKIPADGKASIEA